MRIGDLKTTAGDQLEILCELAWGMESTNTQRNLLSEGESRFASPAVSPQIRPVGPLQDGCGISDFSPTHNLPSLLSPWQHFAT